MVWGCFIEGVEKLTNRIFEIIFFLVVGNDECSAKLPYIEIALHSSVYSSSKGLLTIWGNNFKE